MNEEEQLIEVRSKIADLEKKMKAKEGQIGNQINEEFNKEMGLVKQKMDARYLSLCQELPETKEISKLKNEETKLHLSLYGITPYAVITPKVMIEMIKHVQKKGLLK